MGSGMPTHFEHPTRGSVAVETHVHLLSAHVAAARGVEFVPLEMHEGVIDDRWLELKPGWKAYVDWPISFDWVWRA